MPVKRWPSHGIPIERVANNWVAEIGQMYTYLVRAPGQRESLHEGESIEDLHHSKAGDRLLPAVIGSQDRHLFRIGGVVAERLIDLTASLIHFAHDQRQIALLDRPS